jgi:endo-1,4-beta-xylanase
MNFNSRTLLRYLSAACIALSIPGFAIGQATAPLAKNHSKFLGNIIPHFVPAQYTQLWNQVTPENAGKWESIESTRNTMSWGNLDRAYKLAYDNGHKFRFHTFVWGSQEPGWLKSLSPAQQLVELEELMSRVAQRYPVIHYIDVVNEPLHAPSSMREALGGNGATGWDWVIRSFELARKYFPDSELHLNDYHIMAGWTDDDLNKYLQIIKLLNDRKLIDGIGIQSHHFNMNLVSVSHMKTKLDRLAAFGIPIYVTELDITGKPAWESDEVYRTYREQNPVEDENRQYERYRDKFPVFWEHEGVAGITLWGYIEGTTWAVGSGLLNSNGTERKALTWLREYMASEKSRVTNKFIATSIDNSDAEPEVVVFPNPATSYLYINAHTATAAEFIDKSGRVLLRITDLTDKVDVERWPAGVYLLKVTTPGGISVHKILKQ